LLNGLVYVGSLPLEKYGIMVKMVIANRRVKGGARYGDTASRRYGIGGQKGQGKVAPDVQGFAVK
jgi:hypothetical protein